MNKLPISVGILAWKSGQTLIDTLETYHRNGLLTIATDITLLFQEVTDEDYQIAKHFNIDCLCLTSNIGIGAGLLTLSKLAQSSNILLLEHDWKLIENVTTTYNQLSSGIQLLDQGYSCIRYRHRARPGFPHFSFKHIGNELDYYDEYYKMKSPHLLDSLHWLDPAETFPDKIQKQGEYFVTTSRWGNWTNNPCMYRTEFYKGYVAQFLDDIGQVVSEGDVAVQWAKQNFKVAHGEGLFTHIDLVKYGR